MRGNCNFLSLDSSVLQEKKRKQESERRKNLGGVFALSADDFDKAHVSAVHDLAFRKL